MVMGSPLLLCNFNDAGERGCIWSDYVQLYACTQYWYTVPFKFPSFDSWYSTANESQADAFPGSATAPRTPRNSAATGIVAVHH